MCPADIPCSQHSLYESEKRNIVRQTTTGRIITTLPQSLLVFRRLSSLEHNNKTRSYEQVDNTFRTDIPRSQHNSTELW